MNRSTIILSDPETKGCYSTEYSIYRLPFTDGDDEHCVNICVAFKDSSLKDDFVVVKERNLRKIADGIIAYCDANAIQ